MELLKNPATSERLQKNLRRDRLYWEFRYRNDSYKSRKSGRRPILMMARSRYRGDRVRVYGDPTNIRDVDNATKIAKGIFAGWKQKERERRRLAK